MQDEKVKIIEAKIVQCENGFFIQVVNSESNVALYVAKGVEEVKTIIGDTYGQRKPN